MNNASSYSPAPDSPEVSDTEDTETPRGRFGLVLKTILAMSGVGLVPLILYGVVTLKQQSDRIGGEAELSMRTNAEVVSAQIDEWFDKNIRALQLAATLPAISSMKAQSQTEVLPAVRKAYPWMYLVFTIGMDGQNVARTDDKPLIDYSDRQYYKDVALNGKELALETLVSRTTKKPAIIIAVPIRQGQNVVGVMCAGIGIEDLSKLVARSRMGKTGFAFLVDEKAKVIAHPREEYVVSQTSLAEHPLIASFRSNGQAQLMSFTQPDGKRALGYVQGNRMQWAAAVQQDEDEVYASLWLTLKVGIALLLSSAVLVVLIARFSARRLIRPILDMTRAADNMSMGQLDAPIEFADNDELGLLGGSLERLRKSLRIALERLSKMPRP